MPTLRQFAAKSETVPAATAWYLADLGEARGKQALFTKQSPQRLRVLREHALIESAVSSNRIEGVEVDRARIGTLVFGRPREIVKRGRVSGAWAERTMAKDLCMGKSGIPN